jgi:thiamine pyrophosphokinase
MTSLYSWYLPFLQAAPSGEAPRTKIALIILNQPFSKPLLFRLWHASDWRCCADGGGNRLHDLLSGTHNRWTSYIARFLGWFLQSQITEADKYLPDLVKGDLDSLRGDVRQYYGARVGILSWYSSTVVLLTPPSREYRSYRTVTSIPRTSESVCYPCRRKSNQTALTWVSVTYANVGRTDVRTELSSSRSQAPYDIVLLGGLSGRLDHTIHILAFLHKLRQSGRRIFAVTDDNVGWVLDEAGLVFTSQLTPC